MFKNLVIVFLIIGVLGFGIYTFIKNSIVNRITTEFKTIDFNGFNLSYPPTVDMRLTFNILNGSDYNFVIKKLNVTIYDNINKQLVAKSEVNDIVPINMGNNNVNISVPNVSFLDNASNYFNNEVDLFVVVEFKILGISIVAQEIVKM
jgi:hypothetical protein